MKRSPYNSLLALLFGGMFACAGPNYYFSESPSPDWIRTTPKGISGKQIRMVGASPVTSQVQRDVDLAVADAKAKIGQLFVSEVKARSTDWTLSVNSEDKQEERLVLNQQIEVRTEIKIEDPVMQAKYRDEASRSQYVVVTVDRNKWSRKLNSRVTSALKNISTRITEAEEALSANHPLQAYGFLLKASKEGQDAQADVIVVDLLNPRLGLGKQLSESRAKLAKINLRLREQFTFGLRVESKNEEALKSLSASLETFLNKFGFGLTLKNGSNLIQIKIEVGQKAVKKERVGERVEFIHEAYGKLKVYEPSGQEVRGLSFSLPTGSLQEQSVDQDLAAAALGSCDPSPSAPRGLLLHLFANLLLRLEQLTLQMYEEHTAELAASREAQSAQTRGK